MFYYALISAVIVSLISLIGVVFIFFREEKINNLIFILVAFAAGALIGDSFFHILPEALINLDSLFVFVLVIAGFLLFYILENLIHWEHCHDNQCIEHHGRKHVLSKLNLIGDGIHNFIDGILIGVSYMVSFPVGLATSIAVVAHEIPQEMGDFAILLYSGLSKTRALIYNLISASLAILGVIIVYLGFFKESFSVNILPIVAGGFLYIAMSDLIPELHSHNQGRVKKSIVSFISLILGIFLMYLMKILLS